MGKPLVAHYGDEWVGTFNETRRLVQRVFRTESEVFMIPGVGTTGLEMGIRSCFSAGDTVVAAINGPFGENLARIAQLNGMKVERVTVPLGEPVGPAEVRDALDRSRAAGVLCVHVDTMVGVRNPVPEIGKMVGERGGIFVVDAVSSLGGEELPVDDWGIDICGSAVQKCLGTPPGLAVVSVSAKAWGAMETRREKDKGWYFDLLNWRKMTAEWADWHPHISTMPVSIVLALRESLKEILEEEGLDKAIERHREVGRVMRRGLASLGFRVVREECAANAVTTAYTPAGIEPDEVVAFLRQRHNIQISKFLGAGAPKAIRVGHMGCSASLRAALPVLFGIEELMRARGFDVRLEPGLVETGDSGEVSKARKT
jgi:alanine-glyoxylate transaminase/serine-glyoxylate transaminase/serine-pyruvate transaminase